MIYQWREPLEVIHDPHSGGFLLPDMRTRTAMIERMKRRTPSVIRWIPFTLRTQRFHFNRKTQRFRLVPALWARWWFVLWLDILYPIMWGFSVGPLSKGQTYTGTFSPLYYVACLLSPLFRKGEMVDFRGRSIERDSK